MHDIDKKKTVPITNLKKLAIFCVSGSDSTSGPWYVSLHSFVEPPPCNIQHVHA